MEVSGNVIPERIRLNARRTNLIARQSMFHGQECGLVRRIGQSAFTMVEVMFSMAIVGVLIVALYSALASAVPMVRSCQENERVTQILSEKLDTIRLYNWTQMTNGFVKTNFVVGIEPILTNSRPYYTGTVSIVQAPISEVYRSNLLQVTVKVDWVSGSRPQSQSMVTYIAKYGLQTYIMR
jgi:prepilin-type N-terminal cleavage/methylation domain-containing protein